MAKWVCNVCGYVHEGDEARKSVQYVKSTRFQISQNRMRT